MPVCSCRFDRNSLLSTSLVCIRVYIYIYDKQSGIRCQADATKQQTVLVVGAGWGGLGAAWHLSQQQDQFKVTLIDAAPKVGGLIRDGFTTKNGRPCEAGQHGFWDEYLNIFSLVEHELKLTDVFTDYAPQGQVCYVFAQTVAKQVYQGDSEGGGEVGKLVARLCCGNVGLFC